MHKTVQNLINIQNLIKSKQSVLKDHKTIPQIIAVSKTFKLTHILPLIEHGHTNYGETFLVLASTLLLRRIAPVAALLLQAARNGRGSVAAWGNMQPVPVMSPVNRIKFALEIDCPSRLSYRSHRCHEFVCIFRGVWGTGPLRIIGEVQIRLMDIIKQH